MPSGSISEFKNSVPSHQLANISITRIRIPRSMASSMLLKNGMAFKVRTNVKGFKKYVIDRGLIQNRGVRLQMSGEDDINEGKPFSILAVSWPFVSPKSGRFTDYWIGAPRTSTDSWMGGSCSPP